MPLVNRQQRRIREVTALPPSEGAENIRGKECWPRSRGVASRARFVVWWIALAFLAVQAGIIWVAANGPFVDEGLYTVAGLRVLEGHGLADGYLAWFNGSPFAWPVMAALGHHLAGLAGARLVAAVLSTVTLVAVAKTAEALFGARVSGWCALALGVNGLFLALAHFAVYDVVALTGVAVSMWCVTRSSSESDSRWVIGAAIAFAVAVVSKYGYVAMALPLAGLVVSVLGPSVRALAIFASVTGAIVASYFLLCFGALFPPSSAAYLEQAFGRSRGHIAALQVVFGFAPAVLAGAGALVAWRRGKRSLVLTCLLALLVYPAFHLWTGNFVSGQKHVVAGFLFGSLLAGVALERVWASRSLVWPALALAALALWGGVQCYWQDRSWSDVRPLAAYLTEHMRPGDRVIAESSWSYTLYLYPRGIVASPADVIDANYAPGRHRGDVCRIPWVVGNPDSAELVRDAIAHCRHQPVLTATTREYYFDTGRLRLIAQPAGVGLFASRDVVSRLR